MSNLFDVSLLTAVAALATLVAGLITQILFERVKEKSEVEKEEASKLADAVGEKADIRRARALEKMAEKLPPTTDAIELEEAFQNLSAQLESDLTPDSEDEESVSWHVVEDLVQRYHRQALDQARVQFWFSVAAATVGFGLIIYMVLTAAEASSLEVVFRALPGSVIDGVAALFFRQAGETRERATDLYDRLRSDNRTSRALKVVRSIDDENIRSTVKSRIALHMVGLDVPTVEIETLLSKKDDNGNSGAA